MPPTGRKKIVDLMAKEAAGKKKPAAKKPKSEVIPDAKAGIFGDAVPSLPDVNTGRYGRARPFTGRKKPVPPMGMGIPGLKSGEHHPSEIPLVLPKRPKKK